MFWNVVLEPEMHVLASYPTEVEAMAYCDAWLRCNDDDSLRLVGIPQ
jgi:hypothetical protein